MDREQHLHNRELDTVHWWFKARARILERILKQYASNEGPGIDVGCGTGGNFPFLKQFGVEYGVEPSVEGVSFCHERGFANVTQGTCEQLPYPDEHFSLATALDVIEHCDADIDSLREINRVLKPEGILVVTVPAFMFLWSGHDVISHHRRRYNLKELELKVVESGFQLLKISYFNTLLFPVIAGIRAMERNSTPKSDIQPTDSIINTALEKIFSLESYMLPHINFPFGVSLLCVARKSLPTHHRKEQSFSRTL